MATPNDSRQETRPPTIEDLIQLCRHLNEEGAKYILIGGFAMLHHGLTRATEDIDLLIDPDPRNVEKIKKALLFLPDKASQEINTDDMQKYTVVRVADEIVVDLLSKACEVTYHEAAKKAEKIDLQGVVIPVANLNTMIKTKQGIRPRDKEDLKFLLLLKNEMQR